MERQLGESGEAAFRPLVAMLPGVKVSARAARKVLRAYEHVPGRNGGLLQALLQHSLAPEQLSPAFLHGGEVLLQVWFPYRHCVPVGQQKVSQ